MQAVLKYPGAKNRIVNWIISNIPEHEVYVEPYAGSLSVLLNKQRSHIETVNDLDGEIVNFFRVLRDRPEELERLIGLTPYAREEYDLAYIRAGNELEDARRFCVRCWMGFGCGNLYHNGFKSGQQTNSPNPANAWKQLPEIMSQAAERLKGVQIENFPALEVIKRYDTPDVFLYIDPPYLHGTRKNYLYSYEMEDSEHEELLKAVRNHPGNIMVSGYESELYNTYLAGWKKVYKNALAERGRKRTEVLWMNYGEIQMKLSDYMGVLNEFPF